MERYISIGIDRSSRSELGRFIYIYFFWSFILNKSKKDSLIYISNISYITYSKSQQAIIYWQLFSLNIVIDIRITIKVDVNEIAKSSTKVSLILKCSLEFCLYFKILTEIITLHQHELLSSITEEITIYSAKFIINNVDIILCKGMRVIY